MIQRMVLLIFPLRKKVTTMIDLCKSFVFSTEITVDYKSRFLLKRFRVSDVVSICVLLLSTM